jgi:LuxR family maltose regulon positive regulatory protein
MCHRPTEGGRGVKQEMSRGVVTGAVAAADPEPTPFDHVAFDHVAERFRIPAQPEGFLERPRLMRDLDDGVAGRLTLVSAPAGTGKTTLVSKWARRARNRHPVAWVTIDGADASPERFWRSLAGGLSPHGVFLPTPPAQTGSEEVNDGFIDEVVYVLQERAPRDPGHPLVLVLDCDADLTAVVAHDLDSVLRRSHGWLRVVIVSRVDPPLPLHRYRLAGNLVEIRMADLAFTLEEARQLMTRAGVELPEEALRSMVGRTQGWAAGLRFAAVSMSQRNDQERVALGFRGDTGNVADYLIAEVLDGQPADRRQFLLETSIVDVLRPGLIEAVAGPQAHSQLVQLARGNAYLGELSDSAGWYRYQPLFQDLLRAQLNIELPARVPQLHRAAAAWMFEHGGVDNAVGHSAEAGDWEDAASYVIHDLAIGRLLTPGEDRLATVLARLPADTESASASLVRAALAMASFDMDACEEHLQFAQGQLDGERAAQLSAPGLALQTVKSTHAAAMADADQGLGAAEAAEHLIRRMSSERLQDHPELVALIQSNKGAAWMVKGDLDAAADAYSASAGVVDRPGCEQSLVQCLGQLALLAAIRGQLRKAVDLATRVTDLRKRSASDDVGCPSADVALAWVGCRVRIREPRRDLASGDGSGRSTPTTCTRRPRRST